MRPEAKARTLAGTSPEWNRDAGQGQLGAVAEHIVDELPGGADGFRQPVGKAKVADPSTTTRPKVSFSGPLYGNCWIPDHGENCEWPIVGKPSGRYLWVLSRGVRPDNAFPDNLKTWVKAFGYDWSYRKSDEGVSQKQTTCMSRDKQMKAGYRLPEILILFLALPKKQSSNPKQLEINKRTISQDI